MIDDDPVPLVRRFSLVPRSKQDSDEQEIQGLLGFGGKGWEEIEREYRSVLLAEAGAGKTFEMKARAEHLENQGRPAFFVRIEDVKDGLEQAFEVGSSESFKQWLDSQGEAWFFLDSVDEARLDNPRTFERAIRSFEARIKDAQLRAHIYVSSRPYAWRSKSDPELIRRYLPFKERKPGPRDQDTESTEPDEQPRDALTVYFLRPLDEEDVRHFAEHRSTPHVDRLIQELERSNLMPLAGRPFDLQAILDKWAKDSTLGGRTEMLQHNIELRLRELDPDRNTRQRLSADKARDGARVLAAAVVVTGQAGIRVPDTPPERAGIDAEAVLSGWHAREVQILLERAIFGDVIYGMVRFRHREVRELLAAEWFACLLQRGNSRHAIETLIFRERYGHEFVAPRLRVVLPWLVLEDQGIRERALPIHPEIAVEGGDPVRLPLSERRKILADVVGCIARDEDHGGAQDNGSIARIASPDLTDQTLALIDRYADNDDAIFFLGRLVWQGEMSDCVPSLLGMVTDPNRRIAARIAAARAVMNCGTPEEKATLWDRLLIAEQIPRRLLAELVNGADADAVNVSNLLAAMDSLPPYNSFEATGLREALHGFIERLPSSSNGGNDGPISAFVAGIVGILRRPPFIDPQEWSISTEFFWVLPLAVHAVEKLVAVQAPAAMQDHSMFIMLDGLIARHWNTHSFDDYRDQLSELVPAWPELNDALFWRKVEAVRTRLEKDGQRLIDDWPLQWDCYSSFEPAAFPRVLSWVTARELEDDRLVALSLAFRLYSQAQKPAESLRLLRASVAGDAVLTERLDRLQQPRMSEQGRKWRQEETARQRKIERHQRQTEHTRSQWIGELKADPARVRQPSGLKPGELSEDQCRLLREAEGDGRTNGLARGAAWRSLIDEFGHDVALAYRDAAVAHWRNCTPALPSEGADVGRNRSWEFAMAGLEIEAREVDGFPAHLSDADTRLALRYLTLEFHGFPRWLEAMYRARPVPVLEAVLAELFWELENTEPDRPMYYVLQKLAHHAPWLHAGLVAALLAWLQGNDPPGLDALRQIHRILKSGGINATELASLGALKVAARTEDNQTAYWYALWVDADPDTGVDAVATWLSKLGPEAGSQAAQHFITSLVSSPRWDDSGPDVGNFRTPNHLKSLYVLMHRHIRATEDIHRANTGAYTPILRDHAQDARNRLFQMLSEARGKEAYVAIVELIDDHPEPDYRTWMAKRARSRAEEDGDLEAWTDEQVRDFGRNLTRTPATQRQLFELAVARIVDLKNWLERGSDSPYRNWQKADSEAEMRNLVTGWLNQHWGNSLTAAQEDELANGQRIDILLRNANVSLPVPIEIKILDVGWTGPKICERLCNQLVRDYLRDGTERHGMYLLVWRGTKPHRRWQIGGRLVGLANLGDALMNYWTHVSKHFPNVVALEVVVIDLTLRETKSS
ncbi:MAG: hypothetical protein OXL38_18720 [Gammaproteobacteria bacterium]|nr:hypothetical protein [Gammaproteobacteria bacterium]